MERKKSKLSLLKDNVTLYVENFKKHTLVASMSLTRSQNTRTIYKNQLNFYILGMNNTIMRLGKQFHA